MTIGSSNAQELKRAWKADLSRYEELRKKSTEAEKSTDVGHSPSPPQLEFWTTIADFHPEYAELGAASRRLIEQEERAGYARDENVAIGVGWAASGPTADLDLAFNKGNSEIAFGRLLECVTPALRADTVFNEYRGRYRALYHLTFSQVDELNGWVYRELFGYDPDDPWAGLANLDSLTALPKDRGVSLTREKRAAVER